MNDDYGEDDDLYEGEEEEVNSDMITNSESLEYKK